MPVTIKLSGEGRKYAESGFGFRVGYREYSANSVNAYHGSYGEEPKEDNYVWVNACASVLLGDRAAGQAEAERKRALPEFEFGTVLDIVDADGTKLGLHALMAPASRFLDGDHPVLVPLEGQTASPQAAQRCRRSAAADAKRPIPQYDNT